MWTFILIVIVAVVAWNVYKKKQEEQQESGAYETADVPPERKHLKRMSLSEKWRTVSSWTTLVPGAEGKGDAIFKAAKESIGKAAAPNLVVEERRVSVNDLAKRYGERRLLVVENRKILGYYAFVSVMDYGHQLSVSWYLMFQENWFTKFMKTAVKGGVIAFLANWFVVIMARIFYAARRCTIPELMNIFDAEELTAYTTTVHHAVTGAVEELMGGMNMDFSRVDTRSRGFLNIS